MIFALAVAAPLMIADHVLHPVMHGWFALASLAAALQVQVI